MDALFLRPRPATEVLYDKGSVVVCYACGVPLFRLQQSLYAGEPAAKSSWKYAPVEVKDIQALMFRSDLDAGQIAALRAKSLAEWQEHCERIERPRPGLMADCPACRGSYVYAQTRTAEDGAASLADRGYLWKLATIPPEGYAKRATH